MPGISDVTHLLEFDLACLAGNALSFFMEK